MRISFSRHHMIVRDATARGWKRLLGSECVGCVSLREIYTDKYDAANNFEREKMSCRRRRPHHDPGRPLRGDICTDGSSRHASGISFHGRPADNILILQADAVSAYLAALQDTEVYAMPPEYWNRLFPYNKAFPGSRTTRRCREKLIPVFGRDGPRRPRCPGVQPDMQIQHRLVERGVASVRP